MGISECPFKGDCNLSGSVDCNPQNCQTLGDYRDRYGLDQESESAQEQPSSPTIVREWFPPQLSHDSDGVLVISFLVPHERNEHRVHTWRVVTRRRPTSKDPSLPVGAFAASHHNNPDP